MNISINRWHFIRKCLVVMAPLVWLSCDGDDSELKYSESNTPTHIIEPYLQVQTGFVPFKPGTEKYGIKFHVLNGEKALKEVKVYGSFTDAETGVTTNEVLVATYPIEDPNRSVITDSLTYDELKAGLTPSLPASDVDIAPGSGWVFRFEGVYESNETRALAGAINMVLSKYAGIYVVEESTYVRGPGEFLGTWDGTEVFIGHVDEVTLSYNDRWGVFAWGGCSFNFTVDPDTKEINVPVLGACGLFSGVSALTCKDNKSSFGNLTAYLGLDGSVCDISNVVIDDEVAGHHTIKITYGYLGANGIPRAFTETLVKK